MWSSSRVSKEEQSESFPFSTSVFNSSSGNPRIEDTRGLIHFLALVCIATTSKEEVYRRYRLLFSETTKCRDENETRTGASVRRNKRLRKSPDLAGCNDFDSAALVLSEQRIQRQMLKQSVGKRKISCLEDGDFDHPYALEEQRATLKQFYEASSSGVTSQNSIHQQRPNMESDSLGCVQMQTPSMHPDCNHTSDYTPLLPASIKQHILYSSELTTVNSLLPAVKVHKQQKGIETF
ncbi:hypothetical protein KIW84_044659 [Lathyrus oleraceus]|uniref:Uncharacterized protein n=1 Tax=Pisum sativum TaxID=3888 RepID=A0A9D4XIA0_PEA|nr:hypothetical protein KIW84_044659 [Pisum sativum]